jgi:hypothetical protein
MFSLKLPEGEAPWLKAMPLEINPAANWMGA